MSGHLWSGRFSEPTDPNMKRLGDSLHFDQRLARQDLIATRAHAKALAAAGLLQHDELASVLDALDDASRLLEEGGLSFDEGDEDIHSVVERFLTERLGDTGARIHAGRSRNDLVAADLRLWLKSEIARIAGAVQGVQEALYRQVLENIDAIMPGYTHLQRAQPILLAHHLLAHAFVLSRDFERLIAAFRRADVSPLGAGALAGTSLPIDPETIASEVGFTKVFDNAQDAVASRDFAMEFLAASAICAVHVSRLAEDIVLWTSSEFGFARLDDAFSTGSSIMPQKRNPDVAELARGKSGRMIGNLVTLLTVMKGIPMAYDRDMQEDKEPVFDTAEHLLVTLKAIRGALLTISFDHGRMEEAVKKGGGFATDLAEYLVMKAVPFRHAHEVVGKLVGRLEAEGRDLTEVTAADLEQAHEAFQPDALELLDARVSIERRNSRGGTSPTSVAKQIATLERLLDDQGRWLAGFGGV